jgi:hypothetical protein
MPNTTYGTPYAQSSDLVSNWPGVSLNVADRLDDVSFKGNGLNDQTGTSYTLVLTDAGKTVTFNNAAAVTLTVPTNASVAYETGTCIYFTNKGAGAVTIAAAGGVTINNNQPVAQYSSGMLQKLDTNTWVVVSAPPAGLTLITTSSFSAAASASVNNCFSATYDQYLILVNMTTMSVSTTLNMRLRVSGSDNTSSNYYFSGPEAATSLTTTITASRSAGLTTGFSTGINGTMPGAAAITMHSPFLTEKTRYNVASISGGGTDVSICNLGGMMSVTTSYDGFTLYGVSASNLTGNVRVYGYRLS